jgi:hypothetical protein
VDCPSYSLLISRYLDDALSEEEQADLLLHLSQCPACRWTLARYRRLDTAVREAPPARPRVSFRRTLFRKGEGRIWAFPSLGSIWRPALAAVPLIVAALVAAITLLPATDNRQTDVDSAPRRPPGNAAVYRDLQLAAMSPTHGANVDGSIVPVAALADYLPPATSIEQVAARWEAVIPEPTYVQIIFVVPSGARIRFERSQLEPQSTIDVELLPDKAVIIHGQVWRYARRLNPDGAELVRLLRGSDGIRVTDREGTATFEELLTSMEWLR